MPCIRTSSLRQADHDTAFGTSTIIVFDHMRNMHFLRETAGVHPDSKVLSVEIDSPAIYDV